MPYRGLATMGRLPEFWTSCNTDGCIARLWAMWKFSANHGKHLNPCTQYPNPHMPTISTAPTWEEFVISSKRIPFLDLSMYLTTPCLEGIWFLIFGFFSRFCAQRRMRRLIGLRRGCCVLFMRWTKNPFFANCVSDEKDNGQIIVRVGDENLWNWIESNQAVYGRFFTGNGGSQEERHAVSNYYTTMKRQVRKQEKKRRGI